MYDDFTMKRQRTVAVFFALVIALLLPGGTKAFAQMMGRGLVGATGIATPVETNESEHSDEVKVGKALYERFKNKEVTCDDLDEQDFLFLGEYFMEEHTGSPQAHERMEEMLTAMAGEDGEYNVHVWWGKRGTDCVEGEDPSSIFGKGGGPMMGLGGMMGFGAGKYGMMDGSTWGWYSVVGLSVIFLVVVNLVLAAIWLWKQITKK